MSNDFTSPSIAQHLISLAVADRELIPFRHRLQPLAFRYCQLADYVKAILELNGVLFALDGYLAVLDFVDGYLFALFADSLDGSAVIVKLD